MSKKTRMYRNTYSKPKDMTPERRWYKRVRARWLEMYIRKTSRGFVETPLFRSNYKRMLMLDQAAMKVIHCQECLYAGYETFKNSPRFRQTCMECLGFGIKLEHILPEDERRILPFCVWDLEKLDFAIHGHNLPRKPRFDMQEACLKKSIEEGLLHEYDSLITYPTRIQGNEFWGRIEDNFPELLGR